MGSGRHNVHVTWSTSGGCAPFRGNIGINAVQGSVPHDDLAIQAGSGSVDIPVNDVDGCVYPNSVAVNVVMDLFDGGGHRITPAEAVNTTYVNC
jgi:hypothetical protein